MKVLWSCTAVAVLALAPAARADEAARSAPKSFQIPYRLMALRRPERPPIPARWRGVLAAALIALLIVNWLADVVTGRLASL